MKLKDLLQDSYDIHCAKMHKWTLVPIYSDSTGIEGLTIHASAGDGIYPIRIKVSLNDTVRIRESVTFLVDSTKIIGPKLLSEEQAAQVITWIKLNEKALRRYWEDQNSCGFVDRIKPVDEKVAQRLTEKRKEDYRRLLEMPLLPDAYTGIPGVALWLDQREGLRHADRVKASMGNRFNPEQNVSFSIMPIKGMYRMTQNIGLSTTQEKQIIQWIQLNKNLLLQYVSKLITFDDLRSTAQRIPLLTRKDMKKLGSRKKKVKSL